MFLWKNEYYYYRTYDTLMAKSHMQQFPTSRYSHDFSKSKEIKGVWKALCLLQTCHQFWPSHTSTPSLLHHLVDELHCIKQLNDNCIDTAEFETDIISQ